MTAQAFSEDELAIVRRAFARQMMCHAHRPHAGLEAAFAVEPRERYLGPPPWRMASPAGYRDVASTDPAVLYQDVLFALAEERSVNNGSPSLHARWLAALAPMPGERVLHVGAGTGYYTALIARCVGEAGRVLAVEVDPVLAQAARANLAHLPHVRAVAGDGAHFPEEDVDVVYVNASVERPAPAWLDRLAAGGRILFPLGVAGEDRPGGLLARTGIGIGLLARRRGAGDGILAARAVGPAQFVRAESETGALRATPDEREGLRRALKGGGAEFVRSLRWRIPASPSGTWHAGPDWSLSYEEPSRDEP
ncbi:protein-L-isoaspartate O-methyltransferase family protein [Salinarimonas rosea]|uniref:protein-L-isoaspartate O-methyltransferase family protein n=1 Tax=Salinarimonas rosea TaxID=552063 RepID=UPI0004223678|nr:methyltransferase domain-containing protein [Salinarimonas rosea]